MRHVNTCSTTARVAAHTVHKGRISETRQATGGTGSELHRDPCNPHARPPGGIRNPVKGGGVRRRLQKQGLCGVSRPVHARPHTAVAFVARLVTAVTGAFNIFNWCPGATRPRNPARRSEGPRS